MSEQTVVNTGVEFNVQSLGLSIEVVETLDEGDIYKIESASKELDRLAELLETPDPFQQDRPCEIDLSKLDPEQRTIIVDYETTRELKSMKLPDRGTPLAKLLSGSQTKHRVYAELRSPYDLEKRNNDSRTSLSLLEKDIAKDKTDIEAHTVAPSLVIDARFSQLLEGAQTLPSAETIRVLKNLGLITADEISWFNRRGKTVRIPRVLKLDFPLKHKSMDKIEKVVADSKQIRKYGSTIYKKLIQLVKLSEEEVCLYQLEGVAKIHSDISKTIGDEHTTAIVEEYLVGKIEQVETILRAISATSLLTQELENL